MIDILLAYGAFVLLQTLLFPVVQERYGTALAENGWLLEVYVVLTISLPVWLYFILTERSSWRASLGKRLLGLQVADESGTKATTGQVVLRTVGKLLPWELAHFAVNVPTNTWLNPDAAFAMWRLVPIGLAYLLLFVYLVSAIREPQRAVYDRVAGTVVKRDQ